MSDKIVVPPPANPIAPMSPIDPPPEIWSPEVHEMAKAHCAEAYPNEAAAFVKDGVYTRLENRSETPGQDIALSDEDLLLVADADAFFHSHPDGIGCPSENDMIYQNQLSIPFAIMTWPLYDFFWYGDNLVKAPLIGRGFRHGVHDCFSCARDFYFNELHIVVPDCPRGWEWWSQGKNLYMDNFTKWNFVEITADEATQRGDVLLMNFNYPVPMHAAIVWDADLLLHHPSGAKPVDPTRLSTLVPRLRYRRHVTFAMRFGP